MSIYIKKAIQDINDELESYGSDSRVSVIDFTHFTHLHDDRYLLRFMIFGESKYVDILDVEDKKYDGYALFKNEEIKVFCNLGNNANTLNTESKSIRNRTEESIIKSSQIFDPNDWHQALIDEKLGGCSIIYARKTGNDQSAVYLLLSNAIICKKNGENIDFTRVSSLSENLQKLLNLIFKILDSVLIDELSGNLHAMWQKTELEKHEIEVKERERDLIFRKLFHSQKQHLALLSYLAKEIGEKENKEVAEMIEYTQKSLSEFLDINKYISDSSFSEIKTDLISDLKSLIHVFEIITSDKRILEEGIRLREFQYEPIVRASLAKQLFGGNYINACLNPTELPVGIPKLIFKEIIVNAIQHSKWNEPKVEINITEEEDNFTFNFTNNVTPEMINKLNESVDKSNHGRDLIESLSKKIGWSVFYIGLKSELKVRCTVHINK